MSMEILDIFFFFSDIFFFLLTFFLKNPAVFSFLWIWDPVQSRVLHGSLAATASQPLAVHAHAQAHHHPELQHGELQRRQACPQRRIAAAHISRSSSRSNRGQHHPPEHHNSYSSHQAKSAHRLVNPTVLLRQIRLVTVLCFTRCVWTASLGAIRHCGPEARKRTLHRVHWSATGWGHFHQSRIWLLELQTAK